MQERRDRIDLAKRVVSEVERLGCTRRARVAKTWDGAEVVCVVKVESGDFPTRYCTAFDGSECPVGIYQAQAGEIFKDLINTEDRG